MSIDTGEKQESTDMQACTVVFILQHKMGQKNVRKLGSGWLRGKEEKGVVVVYGRSLRKDLFVLKYAMIGIDSLLN